jgi:hypothetical protein
MDELGDDGSGLCTAAESRTVADAVPSEPCTVPVISLNLHASA